MAGLGDLVLWRMLQKAVFPRRNVADPLPPPPVHTPALSASLPAAVRTQLSVVQALEIKGGGEVAAQINVAAKMAPTCACGAKALVKRPKTGAPICKVVMEKKAIFLKERF